MHKASCQAFCQFFNEVKLCIVDDKYFFSHHNLYSLFWSCLVRLQREDNIWELTFYSFMSSHAYKVAFPICFTQLYMYCTVLFYSLACFYIALMWLWSSSRLFTIHFPILRMIVTTLLYYAGSHFLYFLLYW